MPYFECRTNTGQILHFLIDTGSNKNYIQPNLVQNPLPNQNWFFASSVGGNNKITHHTFINLFGDTKKIKFFLLPTLTTFHGILGNDSLKELSAVIYLKENYMLINKNIKVRIKQKLSQSVNSIDIRTDHLTEEQKNNLHEIISRHRLLFSEPNESLTYTSAVVAEIHTKSNEPVYSRYYPYPMHLKDEVEKQIRELLQQGIIRPSKSPYNSPIWIVPKKSDASGQKKFRMVIDYRKLNEQMIPDRYPIPEINDVLPQLGQNKLFSVLDLKSGFHQIPLREVDRQKTAFSVNNGKYEFTRLPFGLKNAPSIFQRTLDDILRKHIGKICFVYMDDIIIFAKTEKEHYENIDTIFETLERANIKVQLDKCEFLREEVEFLGFIISNKGIKTNPKKVEAILNFPIPKTLKDLRSFLGISNYYRRFIRDYAKIAKPLTMLLRGEAGRSSKHNSKKIPVELDQEATDAFNKIKTILASEDVMLMYPNFNKEFCLTTDASNYALGAVLSQENRPIVFLSRTLSRAEEHYATNEKEMLAIVWALKSLRNYLYGSPKLKIYTDHLPLTYALSSKNSNFKLKRWKAFLEDFNYELQYKPGSTNVVADALSRPSQENSEINTLTSTQHSDESSSHDLIQFTDAPLNVFKNQIIISNREAQPSYNFEIVFPTYHRHTINEPNITEEFLTQLLKKYLNPSVTNCIKTSDDILGRLQEIYKDNFTQYKTKYCRTMVTDLKQEEEQETEIINEHNRAHRNSRENKIQLLTKFYFPHMHSKIKKLTSLCKVCKENKYDRHPNKIALQETPIPTFPGQILHIDIYFTEKKAILTAVDKFSKFAQARILKSRAVEDVKEPLRELLLSFGMPDTIVMDNEKSFNSTAIIFMLENQYNIKVFKIPPYSSSVNGQVERFHSTLSEIMRCLKAENTYGTFAELLHKAVYEYNHSIHSTIKKKPIEAFFIGRVSTNPHEIEKFKLENIKRLQEKQVADINYHNKRKTVPKTYEPGQTIYVKENKRLGTKLSKTYRKEVVKENKNTTILTESGKIIHKNNIKD